MPNPDDDLEAAIAALVRPAPARKGPGRPAGRAAAPGAPAAAPARPAAAPAPPPVPLPPAPEGEPSELELAHLAKLEAIQALREKRKAERDRFREATDTEYWVALCFETRAQKEEFLEKLGIAELGDKYLNGYKVAEKLGVSIDTAGLQTRAQRPPSRRLSDLT